MSINRRISWVIIVLSTLLTSYTNASATQKQPGMSLIEAKQMMPVSQLKRGMKGYGLTVFQGTKIEKFNIEILGVLKQANTGKDFIMTRISGGPISTRGLGVASGMSGSPCYIDGKLIGALSAAMQWSKEPIGMITPIADMMEALDENLPKHASGYSSTNDLQQPAVVEGKTYSKVVMDGPDSSNNSDDNDGELHIRPLAMPVMVSGLSERNIARLAEVLKPFNIKPMAGPGGGSSKTNVNVQLVPGAAVGMSLASGDIDMSAIGTVTYRSGNKLVAWGHPFLGIGAIDAPMTTAYVVDVLTGYNSSTKLAFAMNTIGRVYQDRPWSIAGAIGDMPKTIPVTVTVDDQAFKRGRTYRVNVINHPLLASRLITMVVAEAIAQVHATPGDATAEVSYEVNADQIGKIKRSNVFFDPASIDGASISDVGTLLQMLSSNKFHPVDIKSVNVKVKIADKRNTATIDRVFVKKSEYEPGETVEVGVVLRPYKQERITKTYKIKIPATAPDGKVVLQVRGGGASAGMGAEPSMMAMMMSDGDPMSMAAESGAATADNLKQLIGKYLERERNNQVVVQLMMRSTAINVAGEKLTGLPTCIADVMKSSRNSGLKMERDEVKQAYDDDYIVSGSARLSIEVKQKSLAEGKSATRAIVPTVIEIPDPMSAPGSDDGSPSGMSLGDDGVSFERTATEPSVEISDEVVIEDQEPTPAAKAAIEAAAKPETKTADEKPADKPTPKGDIKTVVRQAKTWSQRSQVEFSKGTFSGVAASNLDKLELTATMEKLVETPEQFVWCVAPAADGVYAGTGNSGKIFHVTDKKEVNGFFDTHELEVHALVRDSKGNIYAGTSPHGKVFKISPDGKGEAVLTTDEKFVVALAIDNEDNVYAGVGDAGKIYKITPDGKSSVYTTVNEQQILSLGWTPKGVLLVGTGVSGVVYTVNKDGVVKPIFDAPEASISSVAGDNEGNVYAGTATKGTIYKIAPDGTSKQVFSKPTSRVLSMSVDPQNNLYAVSDGTLVKISPDETVLQLDSAKDNVQYLSLVFNNLTGMLYAGTGNVGSVYVSKPGETTGSFDSPVHDTKLNSKWGRIKWAAETPEGTSVELQTRTGNVDSPDGTWSDWSKPYTAGVGEQIQGKEARFIQYRMTLKTAKPGVTPRVSSVTLSYLTPNQTPAVKLAAPLGGSVWSGKKTIRWTGSDPDKDTLTYDVYYSNDGGNKWTALQGGVDSAPKDKKLSKEEIETKVKSEIAKSPDIPEDMKKQAGEDPAAKDEIPDAVAAALGLPASPSAATSYTWDTSKVADGSYTVKVVVSDKTSNATGALTEKAISEPFTVCNAAPKLIVLSKKSIEVKGTGQASITGNADSKGAEVAGVQFRIDGGQWTAAASDDGLFDSPSESFTINTGSQSPGSHKVEIQAVDSAGNASSQTIELKVS